jgi:hypothetical protein
MFRFEEFLLTPGGKKEQKNHLTSQPFQCIRSSMNENVNLRLLPGALLLRCAAVEV